MLAVNRFELFNIERKYEVALYFNKEWDFSFARSFKVKHKRDYCVDIC